MLWRVVAAASLLVHIAVWSTGDPDSTAIVKYKRTYVDVGNPKKYPVRSVWSTGDPNSTAIVKYKRTYVDVGNPKKYPVRSVWSTGDPNSTAIVKYKGTYVDVGNPKKYPVRSARSTSNANSTAMVKYKRTTYVEVGNLKKYPAKLYAVTTPAPFPLQSFRTHPHDLVVYQGDNFTLPCVIDNLAGKFLWLKDGYILTSSVALLSPLKEKYQLKGDATRGEQNLFRHNATLYDTGNFQCQATPKAPHKAIASKEGFVTVISPPLKTELIPSRKTEYYENMEVTLECRASNSTPAASIAWLRNGLLLSSDDPDSKRFRVESSTRQIKVKYGTRDVVVYITSSKIIFNATARDDLSKFTCVVSHPHYRWKIKKLDYTFIVNHVPSAPPYVEGWEDGGAPVRAGKRVRLRCVARGGRPAASLKWYRGKKLIASSYSTQGIKSENLYSFTANKTDNKARLTCESNHPQMQKALSTHVDLVVHYGPENVSISGPAEASAGETVTLTCSSTPSNPAANIRLLLDGLELGPGRLNVTETKEGFVSTLSVYLALPVGCGSGGGRHSLNVQCFGTSADNAETAVASHAINVLVPPSVPTISGYVVGAPLQAGHVQQLACSASGGKPPPTLTWFKNNKKLNSQTVRVAGEGDGVVSTLSVLLNASDNQAQYRCQAANAATDYPLEASVTLIVHFPPESVSVSVSPKLLSAGSQATLHCACAASNPPAQLSWWQEGLQVTGGSLVQFVGLHGGTVSALTLDLAARRDLNGVRYTCQAHNVALQMSVSTVVKLDIQYPPEFTPPPQTHYVAIENKEFYITLYADGNPPPVAYSWSRNGLPISTAPDTQKSRMLAADGTLTIARVLRHDGGQYSCYATNSRGTASATITLTVQYGASVVSLFQEGGMAPPGTNTTLACAVDGDPLQASHVTWERPDYDIASKITHWDALTNTSYLYISQVSRADVGYFQCVVDNGLGSRFKQEVLLQVQFPPELDTAKHKAKFGAKTGETARLECIAQSIPPPVFTWSRGGVTLPVNASAKYALELQRRDEAAHVATLLVRQVTSQDYGNYQCHVRNPLGEDSTSIWLEVTGVPEMVGPLHVLNVTHNTVTLRWEPSFDGGVPATYQLRHRSTSSNQYSWQDVGNVTQYVLSQLVPGEQYVFSVRASNELGHSQFRPDEVSVRTLYWDPACPPPNNVYYYWVTYYEYCVGALTALAALLAALAGLLCYCYRRRPQPRAPTDEAMPLAPPPLRVVTSPVPEEQSQALLYTCAAGAVLIVANAAALACFLLRRRANRLKESGDLDSPKSMPMYGIKSSYAGGGDTLGSVSEHSEYPQLEDAVRLGEHPPLPEVPPRMDERTDMYLSPPGYGDYARELACTLPRPPRTQDHRHGSLGRKGAAHLQLIPAPSPVPPQDGSYFSTSDRYLSYPPIIDQYLHQPLPPAPPQSYGARPAATSSPHHTYHGEATLERGSVVPPDVTVLPPAAAANPPGLCEQHSLAGGVKQPQSILKPPRCDPPLPFHPPAQVLSAHTLDLPHYGTIRRDAARHATDYHYRDQAV